MINICVVTANRAEYGILAPLIKKLEEDKIINLDLIVTGSHLDKKYGFTINEIIKDKIMIKKRINIYPKKDKIPHIINSISKSLEEFSRFFLKNKYDYLLVLGDRHELIAPCLCSFFNNIPIIHINGGDVTVGSLDNKIRNFLTSLSTLHFVTNNDSMKRVVKITGNKKNVFNVGSLAVERIIKLSKISKKNLEDKLKIKFKKNNLLITFHPITNNINSTFKYLNEILRALKDLKNTMIVFTCPNNDEGSQEIINMLKNFIKNNQNSYLLKSFGFENYISFAKYVDCVIGNSSSGILEVPILNTPTINIGNRQIGRIFPKSVISLNGNSKKIKFELLKILNKKRNIKYKNNPYYKINTVNCIISLIKDSYIKLNKENGKLSNL